MRKVQKKKKLLYSLFTNHVIHSGANDGLGYPFLFLAIYLMQMNTGAAIGKWAYWIMGYNVLLSCIIGFVAGYVARKLLKYSEQR